MRSALYFTIRRLCTTVLLPAILLLLLVSGHANGQVFAAFKATDTAGCAPLVIHFTNQSTGATSYTWSMGNGVTTTLTDVSTTYLTAGTYTVTLTASDGSTHKDTSVIIRAYGKPTVNFTTSDTAVCPGKAITYTSTSTSNAWGDLAYTWNFGDGNGSTQGTTIYVNNVPGRYNIVLFAMNVKGCVNSRSKSGLINIFTPPTSLFSALQTYFCKYPAKDSFVNTATGKAPLSYVWSFGDGGISTLKNSSHIFTAPGRYDINLQTTDGNGCVDNLDQKGLVGLSGFSASFITVPHACRGIEVRFTNTSPRYTMQQWDFGDGSPLSDSPTHVWAFNGTYPVKLVVYNDTCYDTIVHTIDISHPSGDFSAPQFCTPKSKVKFIANTPPGNAIAWRFGEVPGPESTGIGSPIVNQYKDSVSPLVYTIRMFDTDPYGCVDTVKTRDTIKNHYVTATSSINLRGCLPLTTRFQSASFYHFADTSYLFPQFVSSFIASYPSPQVAWEWNFGDGSPTSTSATPSHTYTAVGVYTVPYRVMYANGCEDFDTVQVTVGTKPIASFTLTPTNSCGSDTIRYTSTTTDPNINEYVWVKGVAAVPYPRGGAIPHGAFSPIEAGLHQSFSLVTAYNGCYSDPYLQYYDVDSAVAGIDVHYMCAPWNGVTFSDVSPGNNSRLWLFDDGTTDPSITTNHYFAPLSAHTVKLTTYNALSGCRDTASAIVDVTRLTGKLTATDTFICRDHRDIFYSAIDLFPNNQVTSWRWYMNGSFIRTGRGAYGIPQTDSFSSLMKVRGINTIMSVPVDLHGCLDTLSLLQITVAKPIDSFRISAPKPCQGEMISFTDIAKDVTGISPASYLWSFGDGTPTEETTTANITHVYTKPDAFNVREIVTDDIGCKDTFTIAAGATINAPVAAGSLSTTTSCANSPVTMINSSTGTVSVLWLFGDGDKTTIPGPTHIYTIADTYTVTLVAYDRFNCTDTLTLTNGLTVNPNPVAGFYMDDSFAVCPPITVDFINTSIGATIYRWDLGDNTGSTSVYPTDIYSDTGLYKIHLTVYNQFSCRDDAYGNVSIFGYAGAFSYTPEKVCASAPVTFTAPASKVIKSIWDYNDGSPLDSISGGVNIHRYAPGAYVPVLTLVGVSGCRRSSIGTDTIKVDTIMADFNGTPDPVCQNNPIALHDRSTPTYFAAKTWSWSFGGGATSTAANPSYTYSVTGAQAISLTVTDTLGCLSTVVKTVSVTPTPTAITGTPIVCKGQPATLSNGLAGGTWSSSNTTIVTVGSTDGIITGINTGTATITYQVGGGCIATLNATVNIPPDVIFYSRTHICATDTTRFYDTPTGGSWTSSNTTVAVVGSGTGIVSGISAGTAVISYSLKSGCTATRIIRIDTMPAMLANTAVCAGNTITLTDAVSGGTWSTTGTTIVTTGSTTGVVTGISPGTTSITYTLAGGCNTVSTVTVNALSTITGDSVMCAGREVILSIPNTAGTWSSSNTTVASVGTSGSVSGISQGTATITYTNPSGCTSTKTVTVNPVPPAILGLTDICAGSTVALSDASGGGTWSTAGTVASIDALTGSITGIAAGTTTVTYTTGLGCMATIAVTIAPLPPPVAGAKNICLGIPTTLTDAIAGGTWTSTDTTVIIFALSGSATGLYTGTAAITYTLPTGCSVMDTITVNPLPDTITGIRYVCPAATISLGETTTGTWSSDNTAAATIDAATGIVTGVAAGTAGITFTSAAGCTASITVTVYPVIAPISGTLSLCNGTTTKLSDAMGGGIWSSADTMIAGISVTGVVSGRTVGTTTLSYSAMKTCDTATAVIKVQPLPYAGKITGTPRLCANGQTSLNDTIAGGTWNSSSNSVATAGSTGAITGVAAGTATISYTYTNSCGSDVATQVILVDAVPNHAHITIHPDTALCSNTLFQNFGADAPEPVGVHYGWSAVNATIYAARGQYALVSFDQGGTGIIKLTTGQDTTNCGSVDSITFHMSNEQSPMSTIIYYAPEFVCRDHTADSYQWGYDDVATLDSTEIPGAVNQAYYNEAPEFAKKNYWVLTYHSGCLQKSYYNAPASVSENSITDNSILLYPNPADNTINIKMSGVNRMDITEAQLTDAVGRIIKTVYITGATGSISLDQMAPGAYMILFGREGKRIEQKTFIKH